MNKYINDIIDEIEEEVITYRRHFHKYPELSDREFKTKEKIIEFLIENKVEFKEVLDTGIHAYIKNGEGKKMAFRADMDALPIKEENDLYYKSKNDGIMHACGHDIHLSVQLGLILALLNSKEKWIGTVNFYFQPAEETTGGAKRMLENGVNQDKNDAILSFHSAPEIEAGKIGIKSGKLHATSAVFELVILGKEAHASLPNKSIDSTVIGAKVVDYIQTIISRRLDARNSAIITIGTFNSGVAENVISAKATLTGTIRAFDLETKAFIVNIFNNELKNYVNAFNAKLEVNIRDSYPPVINDEKFTDYFRNNSIDILGENNVLEINSVRLDVEDFSYFLNEIPGTFYRLGTSKDIRSYSDLHTKDLLIDEKCIRVALLASFKTALEFLC